MKILIILFSITFACGFLENAVSTSEHLPYKAIFNFGDSISDTGNAASLHPSMPGSTPYGATYFKHPSGRMSNGRLIIDFIAEAYGLPMLPAYLNIPGDQDIKKGINFAFAGSTALDQNFLKQKGIKLDAAVYSLSTQFDMFMKIKPTLCEGLEDCDSYFKKSLFIVGEIGGNDLNAIIALKDITKLSEMVSPIIEAIMKTTSNLIDEGAMQLVVPGNFPIGCSSAILATVNSDHEDDYDNLGCLKAYNDFIEDYNNQLQKAIETLRQKNSDVKITYFDYYGATKRLYETPEKFGFTSNKDEIFRACCGKGEPYNLSLEIRCGNSSATICSDPSKQINWDGPHYTEAAYREIAKGLIEENYALPPLKSAPFKIA